MSTLDGSRTRTLNSRRAVRCSIAGDTPLAV